MDAAYPLTVASSVRPPDARQRPVVASLMCLTQTPGIAEGTGTIPPYDPAIQPAQYPPPNDPGVCCESGGSDYVDTTCTEIPQGLCKGTLVSCTSVGYARPTPAPAAWPCTK
jgi:hypothetical protein